MRALKGVKIDVQFSEACGLVGDNGAGKSNLDEVSDVL
jgi:ABC-type sugar transport system ATPase subunit